MRRPMIDILGALRLASVPVALASLLGRGQKTVSIVSKKTISELIHQGLAHVLASLPKRRRRESPDDRLERQREAVEQLQELTQLYQELTQAKADVEASWRSLHDEIARCQGELSRLRARALEPRSDPAVILGAPDFDRRLQDIVKESVARRSAECGAESGKDAKRLQAVLEALVLRLARESRDRLRGELPLRSQISVLERRIEKLFQHEASLADTLATLSGPGVRQPQVEGMLRQLGLLDADPQREKKKEMLKVVLNANKHIRTTADALAREGITLSTPRRPSPAA